MKKLLNGHFNIMKLTRKEYDASVNALNIFFGAVIGISLGNIGEIPTEDYVTLLIVTVIAVTSILFVSYSERRIWSIISMSIVLGGVWWIDQSNLNDLTLPAKLLPTLAVWGLLAVATEYTDIIEEKDGAP
jgi:MFS-type transporter involved in bile tolerance (Atg22 family)